MNTLVVAGNYGSGNLGDDAIGTGVVLGLRQMASDLEVVCLTPRAAALAGDFPAPLVPLLRPWPTGGWRVAWRLLARLAPGDWVRTTRRALTASRWEPAASRVVRQCDALILGGGNLVMDFYPETTGIYCGLLERALRHGKPVAAFGIGAGPLDRASSRARWSSVLRRAQGVVVRDRYSCSVVESLGLPAPTVAPDAAFLLTLDSELWRKQRGDGGADPDAPIGVGVAAYHHPRYWANADPREHAGYIGAAARASAAIARTTGRGVEVFGTKHPYDFETATAVAANAGHGAVKAVRPPRGVRETQVWLSRFAAVVGTRLHTCILTALAGRPVVAVSYLPKVSSFMAEMDWGELCLGVPEFQADPDRLVRLLRERLAAWPREYRSVRHRVGEMGARSVEALTDVLTQVQQLGRGT